MGSDQPGLRRLGEHLWASGLGHGGIGHHEAKSSPLRQEAVYAGIADVIVGLGLELRLHIRELVLQRHEVECRRCDGSPSGGAGS